MKSLTNLIEKHPRIFTGAAFAAAAFGTYMTIKSFSEGYILGGVASAVVALGYGFATVAGAIQIPEDIRKKRLKRESSESYASGKNVGEYQGTQE
jgi:hypothetical protein